MHIAIQKILKLKSQITLVQIYNGLMASIIMLIVVLSSIAYLGLFLQTNLKM